MTKQDQRQFSSDSILQKNEGPSSLDCESNCQVSPDRVVRCCSHEFPSASDHSTQCWVSPQYFLGHVVKSGKSFTFIPRERSIDIPREKRAKFPPGRHQQRELRTSQEYARTTRDTGCLPMDSFLHSTLSTLNLETKHRERHVCSKDQTASKEARATAGTQNAEKREDTTNDTVS